MPPSSVIADPAVVAVDSSPVKPASPIASPVLMTPISDSAIAENLSGVESAVVSQVQSVFASFDKSLEGRYISI